MISRFIVRNRILSQVIRPISFWANIPQAPPDKILGLLIILMVHDTVSLYVKLGLTEAFKADKFEKKVNLGVGAYRDDKGQPFILPSVKEAESRIFSRNMDHE